ncbi:MAG: ABC transporter permease [Ktedonobacteraceae bacterium]|nr:ABC transporter permease [Ktedonobacteraceae bacterium]MBV9615838.1 ABC transporter permease [Ktedonobacteraceae bacterium]
MHYLLNPLHYDLADQESVPNLLFQHLTIVGISMLISLIIALPLGLLVARYRRLYLPVITVSGLLYTIPGLALIAFLVPITELNPPTIIIPLVLYTQLVLIRNTAAAVNGIDPLLPEVGRAMGMNGPQMLGRVTLPLALPVIIAGVRVATVTTIGIATLASLVGQGGLGDLIFTGIQNQNYDQVVAGAIVIALLAILFDLVLLGIQILLNRGRSAVSVA